MPRSSVLNPGRASTTTSRRLAKIFQRSPCCGESDGNLGNILPICRLRNSAQSFRPPSERDFATLTVSACGLSLTDSQRLASPIAVQIRTGKRETVGCIACGDESAHRRRCRRGASKQRTSRSCQAYSSKLDGFGLRDPWNDWRHCTLSCHRIGCSHWDLPSSPEIISYDYPTTPI